LSDDYLNRDYVAQQPKPEYYDKLEPDDKRDMDPNHESIFEHERDAAWLKATWEEYVKPKYKTALNKWNKLTGGGEGTPNCFVNFCDGHRWLVWVFCMDLEANFLLASSAGGRMPCHLQVEAGFEREMSLSSLSGNNETAIDATLVSMEDELNRAKHTRQKMDDAVDVVVKLIKQKKEAKENEVKEEDIDKVYRYSNMMTNEKHLDSMSPDTKRVYTDTLRRKRKIVVDKMKIEEDYGDDKDED